MRIQLLPKILFAVCAFFLSANTLQAQTTETEPNNNPAQANKLPLNGNGSGAINPAGDLDWWKVTTNGDGNLFITLNNSGNQDAKIISLYDTAGIILLKQVAVGNGIGGLNMDGLAAGTFFIKISGSNGTETGAYILSDSLAKPAKANDKEPNNNIMQADILNLNDSTQGHVGYYYNNQRDTTDWYKVTTNEDGLLRITFDNSGNVDAKTVLLYDTLGNPLLNGVNVGNGIGEMNTDGLAAGTYYIQIKGTSGLSTEFGPYTLSDTLLLPGKANDKEPNNIITQAIRLKLNDSTQGHIGYYYNNQRDTTDWYKVTTNSDGLLRITFDNTSHFDTKTVVLYDTTGNPLLNSLNVGNGIGAMNTDGLAAGTYYIQIKGASGLGNEFGPYSLSDTLIIPGKTNDKEPNNYFTEATIFGINDSTTGHIGYYYNHQKDTADWYQLNITNKGKLTLTLDNSGNANTLSLSLYDASGTNLVKGVNVGNGQGGLETDTLATGIYYVQIKGASGTNLEFGPYSLKNSLSGALPVTFINFDGVLQNGKALLSWSTANEINNKGFEVQKSMDGQTFTYIAFVDGQGNSSTVNNYNYTDAKILSGSNYYRLKQIDNDGQYTYSSVIKLDYSKFDWAILGNPSNNIWVQVQLDKSANVTMQVVSMNGNIIQTINKGNLSAGTYSIPINLSGKSAGMYIVRLMVDGQFYSKKIIK